MCDESQLKEIASHLSIANFADTNPDQTLCDLETIKGFQFLPKKLVLDTKLLVKISGISKKAKSDAVRAKAQEAAEHIRNCLKQPQQKPVSRSTSSDHVSAEIIQQYQSQLEEIFKASMNDRDAKAYSTDIANALKKYPEDIKDRFLRLKAALRKIPGYWEEKLKRGTSAEEFAAQTDFRTETEIREEEEIRKEKLKENEVAKQAAVKSSHFHCPRCHSNNVSFYQLQTRSADEPMTNFCTCQNCGKEWRC